MDENSENQNEQAEVKVEYVKVGNFKYYTPPQFEYFKTEDEKAEDEAKIKAAEIKAENETAEAEAKIKAAKIKAEVETAAFMKQCKEQITELTGEVEKLKAENVKAASVPIEKMTDGFEADHGKYMEELARLRGDIEASRAKNIKAAEELTAKHAEAEAAERARLVASIQAEDEHAASTRAALVARTKRFKEKEEAFARLTVEIDVLNAGREFIGRRRL
ncbi:hypothetical protein BKA61DRAFT_581257 [Leptodontidium sp. MPI-SDFR-AT-0119]|nr:hypothetical protein BKA61DRAFT_581257 [Leptodontidium sp. MPI-SDFR-AT-0119]